MSTAKTLVVESNETKDTFAIGESVGKRLKDTECLELISDLGGGKTVFVRGLASGAGSLDQVASPSFTVSRVYRAAKFNIDHYDLYRLEEAGVVGDEVAESLSDERTVTVIEWSGVVANILPTDRLTVRFRVKGPNTRILEFSAGPGHEHLLKNLK